MVQQLVALNGWVYTLMVAVGIFTVWKMLNTDRRELRNHGSSS